MLTKRDKTRGHEENSILSSIYVLLFQSTLDDIVSNQLNAKHDNGTRFRQHENYNNLSHPVTQCARVTTKHTLIKVLVHHSQLQTGMKLT